MNNNVSVLAEWKRAFSLLISSGSGCFTSSLTASKIISLDGIVHPFKKKANCGLPSHDDALICYRRIFFAYFVDVDCRNTPY